MTADQIEIADAARANVKESAAIMREVAAMLSNLPEFAQDQLSFEISNIRRVADALDDYEG
jgi:hypothetical protein